jgi:arginyl-tRNA synthetase
LTKCGETIAEVLGCSAVVVNDLKQRRLRDYDFDWNKILQVNGDTGVKLQYTHCRLFSLNQLCGVVEADELDLKLLKEPEAQRLILEILRYPEVIYGCSESLEACGLVNYLFGLW